MDYEDSVVNNDRGNSTRIINVRSDSANNSTSIGKHKKAEIEICRGFMP